MCLEYDKRLGAPWQPVVEILAIDRVNRPEISCVAGTAGSGEESDPKAGNIGDEQEGNDAAWYSELLTARGGLLPIAYVANASASLVAIRHRAVFQRPAWSRNQG